MSQLFTKVDTWLGGFYELSIALGKVSERAVFATLCAVWSYPCLQGCYLDRSVEPNRQPRLSLTPSLLRGHHLLGIASLTPDTHVACGTCVVRESTGVKWVNVYFPLGALAQVYPVGGYPFGDLESAEQWQPTIDTWLADLAQYIFTRQPFPLGLIGFEVSGATDTATIRSEGIPQERYIGYLWPELEGISYYPRNKNWSHK